MASKKKLKKKIKKLNKIVRISEFWFEQIAHPCLQWDEIKDISKAMNAEQLLRENLTFMADARAGLRYIKSKKGAN